MRRKSSVTSSFAAFAAAALCLFSARNAQAKPSAPPVKNQVATTALAIPVLPNARVQLELDASEKDLLGMLKSFVRGLEKANAQGKGSGSSSLFLQLVADKQFSTVLKDVHHLHVVVYDLRDDEDDSSTPMNGGTMSSGTMSSGTMQGGTMHGDATAANAASFAPKVPEPLAFYDRPFRAEGGRRVLKADFKSTRVAMFGFQKTPGFALVVSSPSRVVVARADAYPDMEALGRMIELASSKAPVQKSAPKAPAAKAKVPAAKAKVPAVKAKVPAVKAKPAAIRK